MKNKITILIRTRSGRGKQLAKCLQSITEQTYKNYEVIIGSDYGLPNSLILIPNLSLGNYFYNDYCNVLKNEVTDGYFFFLDDDDVLVDNKSLERISNSLNENGLICQMKRGNGIKKPSNEMIDKKIINMGKIGMPCLVLHSKHKDIADITATSCGDFDWIKSVSEQVELNFTKEVLVYSEKRNFGK